MAKKSKPVKKAVPKKQVAKKPVAKKVVKKLVKKEALKKAAIKPAAPKGKKAPVKKAAPKKALPKKAAPKKAVAKPVSQKGSKPVAKKVIAIKKTVPVKAAVKPALPPVKKIAHSVLRVVKKKPAPVPSVILIPDGVAADAANLNKQMMVPGDGLNEAPVKAEDPIKTFDKNVFNKATSKGDPHSNRQLSSKPKNAIKPSGKKPLW